MLEPPDLGDDQLVGTLEAGYGTRVAALTFLPIGNDPASWSYRVEQASGPARFLKVRAGQGMPGAAVPAHLHRHRVPNVLARCPPPAAGRSSSSTASPSPSTRCWRPPPGPTPG